jgi:hypothetical protein
MNETTFDESMFETDEVSELDCVKYAYGRHITIDGLDEHPLTAQDEFLACMARHVDWEDSALVPDAKGVGEAAEEELDESPSS